MVFVLILFGLPSLLVLIDFFKFLLSGERLYNNIINRVLEFIVVIGLPLFYLVAIDESANNCCSDSASFAPGHKLTIYVLIIMCVTAFFYSSYKKTITSPIIEIITNTLLIGGIVFNIFIAIHIEQPIWIFGNLPIIILFIFELIRNQKLFLHYSQNIDFNSGNIIEKLAWKVLNLKLFLKIPILLVLCLPILVFVSGFLLLFGQKPDSIIRAFTDTYRHGFSQLDYMCDNVACGGHFLCSVAANGHKGFVKPKRLGERGGNIIMCNRQLLISNAFEELIEQKFPKIHRVIRRNYNKIGSIVHRYYGIFNNKFVADFTYVLMKPLEWVFLITLYTFDKNPENRIAKQYLNPLERKQIENNKK
ncbi:MAG: hypothetical protein B6I20_07995 [Bacteroidetes bacterium 4572_117]|nr:MAG: hypothetical protein B6I20_07995 [Bacteroidetes bacterium 4572_117]